MRVFFSFFREEIKQSYSKRHWDRKYRWSDKINVWWVRMCEVLIKINTLNALKTSILTIKPIFILTVSFAFRPRLFKSHKIISGKVKPRKHFLMVVWCKSRFNLNSPYKSLIPHCCVSVADRKNCSFAKSNPHFFLATPPQKAKGWERTLAFNLF